MNSREVRLIDLGVRRYQEVVEIQRENFDPMVEEKAKKAERHAMPTLILCEHPHVYTLGKSGEEQNMLITPEFLKTIDAEYYQTDRGGDITYHGPGQLVGYPILDLEEIGIGLKQYINKLERTIINTIAKYGVVGEAREDATGVWIEPSKGRGLRKISAIGVKSSRFITMHGFALNVDPVMEYFKYINPCGFTDRGVTSMQQELGEEISVESVKKTYIEEFEKEFAIHVV